MKKICIALYFNIFFKTIRVLNFRNKKKHLFPDACVFKCLDILNFVVRINGV